MKRITLVLACALLTSSMAMASEVKAAPEVGMVTSTTLLWADEQDLEMRLQDIRSLGATWIRVDFNWNEIQPDDYDSYKWGSHDRVVKAAKQHGLKILAVLGYPPHWAQNPNCTKISPDIRTSRKCSPRNTVEFGRFARATILRYKDQGVKAWEIWNEPNLVGHWRTARADGSVYVDPEAYARTANAAALELKNHDPEAFVITGGLAPMFDKNSPKGMRQGDFLAQVLPHLRHDLFDAVGIHPYTWPKMPELAADYNAFYTVDNGRPEYNLRGIMAAALWDDKQIWATEFGASTRGQRSEMQSHPKKTKRPDHVSERKQAMIIKQGVDMWYKKHHVGPIFVHSDSDRYLRHEKNEGGYGLRRKDGTKKPAYDAFQQVVKVLRGNKHKNKHQ